MKFSQIKETNNIRIIALLSCLILILCREFYLIIYPRLWAEEGKIFLSFAYKSSFKEIFTTVHVGYFTLFNSIVSFLQAKVFAIEFAPLISTIFGLVVQLTPVIIIIYSSYFLWDNVIKKTLCLLIVILIIPPELYLNTTNSHFILGLCCFLIALISSSELGYFKKWFYRMILFLGAFTGPATMFLTPVFLFRAYTEKQKERYIQAAIITIGAIIQASIIIYSIKFNNHYHRLEVHDISRTIQSFLIDNFSLGIHGIGINDRKNAGIFIFIYSIYLFVKKYKEKDIALIFASFLILSVFSTLGSLSMQGSPRYAYIPSCMLYFIILSEFFVSKNDLSRFRKSLSYIVFFVFISFNILMYQIRMREVYKEDFPKWKTEIAKWKLDNSYKPQIHPQNDVIWDMELKK